MSTFTFRCIDCSARIEVKQAEMELARRHRADHDREPLETRSRYPDDVEVTCGDVLGKAMQVMKEIASTGIWRPEGPDDGCGAAYSAYVDNGQVVVRPKRTRLSVACWFCDGGQVEPSEDQIEAANDGACVEVRCSGCECGIHELELDDDGEVSLSWEPIQDEDEE